MRLIQNSLHDEVAAALRDRIFSGEFGPGAFLDEVQLADDMKISRTPLREALKVLTAEGLVRHEPRRGCFVNEVTEQDLDEIFPVIALLEGRCAFEAARNATDADLQTIAVGEQAQGRGVATSLLRTLLDRAAQRGARRIVLEVRADNDAAQALYRRFGFAQIARRSRYYPDGSDALIWQAPLPLAGETGADAGSGSEGSRR